MPKELRNKMLSEDQELKPKSMPKDLLNKTLLGDQE